MAHGDLMTDKVGNMVLKVRRRKSIQKPLLRARCTRRYLALMKLYKTRSPFSRDPSSNLHNSQRWWLQLPALFYFNKYSSKMKVKEVLANPRRKNHEISK